MVSAEALGGWDSSKQDLSHSCGCCTPVAIGRGLGSLPHEPLHGAAWASSQHGDLSVGQALTWHLAFKSRKAEAARPSRVGVGSGFWKDMHIWRHGYFSSRPWETSITHALGNGDYWLPIQKYLRCQCFLLPACGMCGTLGSYLWLRIIFLSRFLASSFLRSRCCCCTHWEDRWGLGGETHQLAANKWIFPNTYIDFCYQ